MATMRRVEIVGSAGECLRQCGHVYCKIWKTSSVGWNPQVAHESPSGKDSSIPTAGDFQATFGQGGIVVVRM